MSGVSECAGTAVAKGSVEDSTLPFGVYYAAVSTGYRS